MFFYLVWCFLLKRIISSHNSRVRMLLKKYKNWQPQSFTNGAKHMVNVENCIFLKVNCGFLLVIWVKWKQSVCSIILIYFIAFYSLFIPFLLWRYLNSSTTNFLLVRHSAFIWIIWTALFSTIGSFHVKWTKISKFGTWPISDSDETFPDERYMWDKTILKISAQTNNLFFVILDCFFVLLPP